jgi:hypothetical protein
LLKIRFENFYLNLFENNNLKNQFLT